MQGPSQFFNILTIPFGAGPGQERIVFNGITGEIDVYGTGLFPRIVISSALDAIFIYAGN
jgi:hypothetical protein